MRNPKMDHGMLDMVTHTRAHRIRDTDALQMNPAVAVLRLGAMNFATDADLAAALLARVRELRTDPVELVGDNVLKFYGPSGVWRIRCVCRNGRFSTMVYTPERQRLYALDKIKEHLACRLSPNTTTPAVPDVVDYSEEDSGDARENAGQESAAARNDAPRTLLEMRAVLTIQSRVRAWRVHRSTVQIQDLVAERARLTAALENTYSLLSKNKESIQHLTSRRESQWTCTLRTVEVETAFLADHPSIVFAVVPTSFTTVPGPLRVMPAQETGLTRAAVIELANEYVHGHPVGSMPSVLGKAVVREPHHFPLLLGPLSPPPDGLYRHGTCYARVSRAVSGAHGGLLSRKFGKAWRAHIQSMLTIRPNMAIIDVTADRNEKKYLGSVVVAKMLARAHGVLSPALSIESIVAVVENDGTGGKIMEMCRDLLWADTLPTVRRGFMYAQCLNVGFWVSTLELTNAARALALQTHIAYPSYYLDKDCHVRGGIVERYPDTPSPTKQIE